MILKKFIYESLNLINLDEEQESKESNFFKRNFTKKADNKNIFLGYFRAKNISSLIAKVANHKIYLIEELLKARDLTKSEREYLQTSKPISFKEYSKLFDSHIFNKLAPKIFDKISINSHLDKIKSSAESEANLKLKDKLQRVELTEKEKERFKESFIKNRAREEKSSFLDKTKTDYKNFISKYSNDVKGYLDFLQIQEPKIYQALEEDLKLSIPETERLKHTYITGATGSGKSELLKVLIHSYIKLNLELLAKTNNSYSSIVLIEPHGDLAEEVAKFKENAPNNPNFENLIYINPYLDKNHIPSINPFELKEEDKTEQNIDILSQELTRVFEEILGTNFTLNMQSLLNPCIATILRANNKDNPMGLKELQRLMDDENNQDLINLGLSSPNEAHRTFFESGFKNRNLQVTKQSIYTKIQTLLNSSIFNKLITTQSSIDLEKELNQKKLIIFNLSKGSLGSKASETYGRFITALINFIALKRANRPKSQRVPIHLFIDEAQNYISKSIETTLTENRKYKLYLTLAQQILGQKMDKELEKIILSNTNIKITGINALDTLQKISKETNTPLENLQEIETGEFFIKVAQRESFKFKVNSHLVGNRNQMSLEEWNKLKEYQVKRYYRPLYKTRERNQEQQQEEPSNQQSREQKNQNHKSDLETHTNHQEPTNTKLFLDTSKAIFDLGKSTFNKIFKSKEPTKETPKEEPKKQSFTKSNIKPKTPPNSREEIKESQSIKQDKKTPYKPNESIKKPTKKPKFEILE